MIRSMEEDSTVIIPLELLPTHQYRTSLLAREMRINMDKKKDNKLEQSREYSDKKVIMKLVDALSEDRLASEKKFELIFKRLEDLTKMSTRFKLYEKVLGTICLIIVYGIVDKFL